MFLQGCKQSTSRRGVADVAYSWCKSQWRQLKTTHAAELKCSRFVLRAGNASRSNLIRSSPPFDLCPWTLWKARKYLGIVTYGLRSQANELHLQLHPAERLGKGQAQCGRKKLIRSAPTANFCMDPTHGELGWHVDRALREAASIKRCQPRR